MLGRQRVRGSAPTLYRSDKQMCHLYFCLCSCEPVSAGFVHFMPAFERCLVEQLPGHSYILCCRCCACWLLGWQMQQRVLLEVHTFTGAAICASHSNFATRRMHV